MRIFWLRLLLVILVLAAIDRARAGSFSAGVAAVDISPPVLPVIQNGGFLEASLKQVVDPIHARAFVFSDEVETLAIVVVDSCMLPRTLCDQVKAIASRRTGLARDRILISATHTHSAPSVMDFCLGSRRDPRYAQFLPNRIAAAIEQAYQQRQPAQAGWAVVDASEFTKNRRWITRADAMGVDPFGEQTVRAMMHPGHGNPDYVGPSGPVDPWLTVLSLQDRGGRPLGVLANFSMHYFGGHSGVSSDYYGRYAALLKAALAPSQPSFVAAMSQGTSGDLWWGDYSLAQRQSWDLETYSQRLVDRTIKAFEQIEHRPSLDLAMAEVRMTLDRRVPSEARLAWAAELLAKKKTERPASRPEVYAEQAEFMAANPREEVVLQALRIGDLAVAALPNEVYALTGWKLKTRSPAKVTMNISLANGAAGYIPPPEQHDLGGYTTWPARTAGLEVAAEPKMVAALGGLLEEVIGDPIREPRELAGAYATALERQRPRYRWSLGEQERQTAGPSFDAGARFEGQVAFYVPGVSSRAFGAPHQSRAVHFAGGRLAVPEVGGRRQASVGFWFWSGLLPEAPKSRQVLMAWGEDQLELHPETDGQAMHLVWGNEQGATPIRSRQWYSVMWVRDGSQVRVYLNGISQPEIGGEAIVEDQPAGLYFGSDRRGQHGFEGRLDEAVVFDRVLGVETVVELFRSAETTEVPALSPRASMEQIHVREGYELELVAAEPLVRDPVAIDWDAEGRLWVAEMADYPYGLDGKGAPGGRVRWLEDSDGDGRYDRSQVFLEGINFPTSVMPWRNGVLVTAAPELFYAEDCDGDGRADRKEVLFRGFMEGNQQLRVNSLRWGMDGWVYCASGGHHAGFGAKNRIRAVRSGQEIALGSRDFRFRPDSGDLEALSGPSQFGRVRDDWGHWFGVQNTFPIWHYVLPDPYLQRNRQASYPDPRRYLRERPNPRVYMNKSVQKRYHSFEQSSRFTSACGPAIYRDGLLFDMEPGLSHAFTCEPFHNVVQHHVLTRDGTTFVGRRASQDGDRDFFASADRWSRPVMTRTGPDGALWVVDMYRYMIEHPDWLPAEGREELKPFYRAGEAYGRIYRVYPKGRRPGGARTVLDGLEDTALLEAMESENGRVRGLAQQRMVERQNLEWVPGLRRLAVEHRSARVRLQALMSLATMGQLSEADLLRGLHDPEAQVRKRCVALAERYDAPPKEIEAALLRLTQDSDLAVRLQLALSLGQWTGEPYARTFLALARSPGNEAFLNAALTSSLTTHWKRLAKPLLDLDRFQKSILALESQDPGAGGNLVERLLTLREPVPAVAAWIDAQDAVEADWLARCRNLPRGRETADQLLGMMRKTRDLLQEGKEDVSAVALLGRESDRVAEDVALLVALTGGNHSKEMRLAVLERLRVLGEPGVGAQILARWPSILPMDRTQVIDLLLSRENWASSILDALDTKVLRAADLSQAQRHRLESYPARSLAQRAKAAFDRAQAGMERIGETLLAAVEQDGDAGRGKRHFEERCATCHALGGLGRAVGPDLRSLSNRTPAAVLAAILDPNQAIEPKYLAYTVALRSGEQVYGMVERESGNNLVLRLLDGTERAVNRAAIVTASSSGASLMPEGLAEGLSAQQMADLLAFVVTSE